MRNLTLYATSAVELSGAGVSATAIDVDEGVVYAASEREDADGNVVVEVWNADQTPPTVVATFSAVSVPGAAQVVALRVLPEVRRICAIMRSGDITMLSLEDGSAEVEGTVERGISAAAWSPDESLLVVVTGTPAISVNRPDPSHPGEDKLVLMTATFDVLAETPLHALGFGQDAPINVGWGSKQTQFHGSLGKAAAHAPTHTRAGASPDDDRAPRISWRGDAAFFAVSALSPAVSADADTARRRVLRVYDRDGALQSTSEAVPGLEHALAWRPAGNLLAATQRFGFEGAGAGPEARHDVVFFERNGLRHGEFAIRAAELRGAGRWGYRVKELSWSSDSGVLAVWVERDEGDVVQLWTMGNYYWYLKQEIEAPAADGRFTSVSWHPEQALHILLTTKTAVIQRSYAWDTFAAPSSEPPHDTGAVAVFDGTQIKLTPFRTHPIPPPLSSAVLALSSPPRGPSHSASATPNAPRTRTRNPARTPIHAAFARRDALAVLWESGHVELWALRMRTREAPARGRGAVDPVRVWAGVLGAGGARAVCVLDACDGDGEGEREGDYVVGVLWRDRAGEYVSCVRVGGAVGEGEAVAASTTTSTTTALPSVNSRFVCGGRGVVCQGPSGEIHEYDAERRVFVPAARFPEFCLQAQCVPLPLPARAHGAAGEFKSEGETQPQTLYIGLGRSGTLHAASGTGAHRVLAANATSFAVAAGFVMCTTTAHEVRFVRVESVGRVLAASPGAGAEVEQAQAQAQAQEWEWETRRVERGSRIVVAVPSAMALVLQMPRGNLETISPRPLVLEVVKRDIDACVSALYVYVAYLWMASGDYRKAFFACRKHRINLNVLVEHDEARFLERIAAFVEQIGEVEHVNLFLSNLGCVSCPVSNLFGLTPPHPTPPPYRRGTQPAATIARLCDAVRVELERKDLKKYVNSILTAYVVKTPPEHEAALALLLRLRAESHPEVVEDAVKYIIFLVDADRLFDTALGMYDFSLVLMIAQHAQKDPREYLPFLRELRALDKYYQRFKIDDHLRRYEGALRNLSLAGADRFEEAVAYIESHTFCNQIVEDINECLDQLRKQLDRIRELRIRKVEEPDAFYGTEDVALHNVDVMTDVSMAPTAFTRYTVAPTTTSRSSRRTSRSKRKMERKVGSGRKGTVDEEEYLLKSLTKLAARFATIQDEARNLLPHLLQFTLEHREEGTAMQKQLADFEGELSCSLDEIWAKPPEEAPVDSWATRMEQVEKDRRTNPVDKVPKPELSSSSGKRWRINLFDVEA
ncbi:hypothetical protein C0993_000965 [Termitomyces sp. T159_Od127]|nr:hypothetical protein C0993_000965 [Termitomyces sp. T159_Od127]